jgi:hypothetical protein
MSSNIDSIDRSQDCEYSNIDVDQSTSALMQRDFYSDSLSDHSDQ